MNFDSHLRWQPRQVCVFVWKASIRLALIMQTLLTFCLFLLNKFLFVLLRSLWIVVILDACQCKPINVLTKFSKCYQCSVTYVCNWKKNYWHQKKDSTSQFSTHKTNLFVLNEIFVNLHIYISVNSHSHLELELLLCCIHNVRVYC